MATTIIIPHVVRRGTAAAWAAANPVLLSGEQGLETDTYQIKYGNGSSPWNSLAYFTAGAGVDVTATTDGISQSGGVLRLDIASLPLAGIS